VVFFHDFGAEQGLDPGSRARVAAGAALYRAGVVGQLLCVGGNRQGVVPSGAQRMAAALVAAGVPPQAVRVDAGSYDTVTNWREARAVLEAHGWQQAVLVSAPLHLYRILQLAAAPGLTLSAAPSADLYNDLAHRPLEMWWEMHREWLAWMVYGTLPLALHPKVLRVWRDLTGSPG
jgi:uncharacterized SAM-binding protein YcdF (DUF218 family)